MNKEEIIAIFKILKVAYPRFYIDISKEDMIKTINLWLEMFQNNNKQDITKAIKELICELEFPPTIADVKKKINKYESERKLFQTIKAKEERQKSIENAETKLLEQPKENIKKANPKEYIKNIKKIILGDR